MQAKEQVIQYNMYEYSGENAEQAHYYAREVFLALARGEHYHGYARFLAAAVVQHECAHHCYEHNARERENVRQGVSHVVELETAFKVFVQ